MNIDPKNSRVSLLMNPHYPRTPLLARLGYLLMLIAAIALSYPIIVDIVHQFSPGDQPVVSLPSGTVSAISAEDVGNANFTDLRNPENALNDSARRLLATPDEGSGDWEPNRLPSDLPNALTFDDGEVVNASAVGGDELASSNAIQLQSGSVARLDSLESRVTDVAELVGRAESTPVVQNSPRHDAMVTPGDFTYMGAFRLPHVADQKSRFAYGGHAITFCPSGDKEGANDGFSGSLYMVGHKHHELVTEVSIPRPYVSTNKSMDELPVAKVIQPFADVTLGLREQLTGGSTEAFEFGGLFFQNDRLHWTLYKYYNVSGVDYLSHGLSSADLSNPSMAGMWHLGPRNTKEDVWHSYKHAGYIADIPQKIADRFFQGRSMMSGLQISTGLQYSSQGPALYAYRPPTGSEAPGSSLDATPLLWYPLDNPVDQHHPADSWSGAAWVNIGGKNAVAVVGRKAHGEVYYGEPRPNECYTYKGYHGSSYEVQMLFYAPAHLLKSSKKRVADVQPFSRWDSKTAGGGIDRFMFQKCRRDLGGMGYDRKNNLLYISEMNAGRTSDNEWEPLPIIHVFKIGGA
ncbi:MAG: hypothetical protein ABJZ55_06565 [Fuerstiella sp.]